MYESEECTGGLATGLGGSCIERNCSADWSALMIAAAAEVGWLGLAV
jgi:hypothetical protein